MGMLPKVGMVLGLPKEMAFVRDGIQEPFYIRFALGSRRVTNTLIVGGREQAMLNFEPETFEQAATGEALSRLG